MKLNDVGTPQSAIVTHPTLDRGKLVLGQRVWIVGPWALHLYLCYLALVLFTCADEFLYTMNSLSGFGVADCVRMIALRLQPTFEEISVLGTPPKVQNAFGAG